MERGKWDSIWVKQPLVFTSIMESSIQNLENHELSSVMRRMSGSGQLQVLRTILIPEASKWAAQHMANALQPDPAEWMMLGVEGKGGAILAQYGLLDLFRQTQEFEGYQSARESCKKALGRLSMLKQSRNLNKLTPGTPEFDIEYFFLDFVPGNYQQSLIFHQGTIADAAGRGDLAFFKRLYNRVKNDETKKAGGQYEHFLVTTWLHGFLWLMPDRLACRVVIERMRRIIDGAKEAGLKTRKSEGELKLGYSTRAWHEAQRKRFCEAVKSLGLYQHPESPLIETKSVTEGEPNTSCYVWKAGWPK